MFHVRFYYMEHMFFSQLIKSPNLFPVFHHLITPLICQKPVKSIRWLIRQFALFFFLLNQSMNALDSLKGWQPYYRNANFNIKNGQTTISFPGQKVTGVALSVNAVYTTNNFSANNSIVNGNLVITLYDGVTKAADGVAWLIVSGLIKLE